MYNKISIGKIDSQRYIKNCDEHTKKINRDMNILTIKAHETKWERNLKRNCKNPLFQNAKTIKHIAEEIGENKEICLIGAGNSVVERIDDLRKLKERGCILLATDAITKWLFDNEIIPDYVFILDSKKEGIRFFSGLEERLKETKIVVSSAVDKEFLPYIECFKSVYAYHMYDPCMENWGGSRTEIQVINNVGLLDKNKNYAAHVYLPNLDYVMNKGNVGNLILVVGSKCKPKVFYGIGNGYCMKFDKDGNVKTRAKIRDDEVGHEIGGKNYDFRKIMTAQRPYDGKLFLTKGDFFGYAKIAMDFIKEMKVPYRDLSDGLLRRTKNETELV